MAPRENGKKTPCLISPVFRSGLHILRQDRPLVIGRRPSCDVVLPHRSVSRRHCQIEWDEERYRLVDLQSSNGTYLDGKRLTGKHRLHDDDSFSIGPFRLTYRELQGDLQSVLHEAAADPGETRPTEVAPEPQEGVRFSGSFTDMELIEICQFLAINQKSGKLKIEGSGFDGTIEFLEGRVLKVSGDGSWQRKSEGFRRLLSQPEGRFSFVSQDPDLPASETPIPTFPLLMELCRERDEELAIEGDGVGMFQAEDETSPWF